ncbi:hypothetical protein [Sphingomonas colocasiae]|nr:hypothetical protein [Sphingomonas colocasiae]
MSTDRPPPPRGDRPRKWRWPGPIARGRIVLALVCAMVGFVMP